MPAMNCLPCLKSATSWKEFTCCAFICFSDDEFPNRRLFSACSDKKLPEV